MMWHCNDCGADFDEPNVRIRWENLDGENGWQEWREKFCPYCGTEDIEDDVKDEDNQRFQV